MQWKEVERIIKENEKYTDMLGYYDSTGKLPTKKVLRSFTLKQINFDRLKAESQRTGRNMSKILDELIESNIT